MTIKWVKVDPLVMRGEPFLYNTRLTVRQLLELRRNGYGVARLLMEHPELRVVGIAQAYRYAAENRERYTEFFGRTGSLHGDQSAPVCTRTRRYRRSRLVSGAPGAVTSSWVEAATSPVVAGAVKAGSDDDCSSYPVWTPEPSGTCQSTRSGARPDAPSGDCRTLRRGAVTGGPSRGTATGGVHRQPGNGGRRQVRN